MKIRKGFTLVEVVVTIGIISLFVGLGAPLMQTLKVKNDLRSATVTIVQGLRRAQILAQSGSDDLPAGVYIESDSMTVFRGTTYLTRLSSYDDVYDFPSSVSMEGIQEIVYAKLTGYPDTTGPIIILNSSQGESARLNLNSKGTITY